jgi:hypothetical protein
MISRSNFTPHHQKSHLLFSKVLKAATLDRTDKHEERSEQKTFIFGLYEMLIHLSFIGT